MKVQKNIEVWLVKKRLPRPIDLVQYDTGIQIVFALQDFTIPGGTTATLYVQKPSGKFVYQETGITTSENSITIDLENQAITEHGNDIPYQVQLENGTDLITTFAGIFRVEKSLKNVGAVESKTVIAAFEAKTAEQLAKIEAETLDQIAILQAASQTEQEAIENKGLEVLNTIPADYTATAALAEKVNREKGSAIVCEAEGEVITVADASNDYVRGLKLFGKTKQQTTTGKNLLDVSRLSYGDSVVVDGNKITVTPLSTGQAVVPGCTLGEALKASPGDTVTISGVTTGTNRLYIVATATSWLWGTSLTLTDEMLASDFYLYGGATNGTPATITNLQIELGEVATAYEPYTGGAPSPSPDHPQELVSAGASGAINTTVAGKNIFGGDALADRFVETSQGTKDTDAKTVKYTASHALESLVLFDQFKPNTQYTIIWVTNEASIGTTANMTVCYADGTAETMRYKEAAGVKRKLVYTTHAGKSVTKINGAYMGGTQYLLYEESGIFEGVLTEADFEPYVGHTLTASTVHEDGSPNGLPGIPVSSGGNYTDENGQQWICDEIDFARGVYVQRVEVATASGNELWYKLSDVNGGLRVSTDGYFKNKLKIRSGGSAVLCSHFSVRSTVPAIYQGSNTTVSFYVPYSTVNEWKDFLAQQYSAGTPVVAIGVIATPIETPLSAEEIAAFKALHSNKPNTTAYNDSGAHMALEYNADTKSYIDNKFAELAAAIVNNA